MIVTVARRSSRRTCCWAATKLILLGRAELAEQSGDTGTGSVVEDDAFPSAGVGQLGDPGSTVGGMWDDADQSLLLQGPQESTQIAGIQTEAVT